MGMPPEVRAVFDRDFEAAYLQAMAFALKRCRTLPWVSDRAAVIRVAREFVGGALELTLAHEERPWNPRTVGLAPFLCGVVRSLVSNAVERRKSERIDELRAPDDVDERADASVGRPVQPESFYLSSEACQHIESEARALAVDDPVLSRFVTAVVAGLHDVEEISKATGLTAKDVYAAKGKLQKRRIRRSL